MSEEHYSCTVGNSSKFNYLPSNSAVERMPDPLSDKVFTD